MRSGSFFFVILAIMAFSREGFAKQCSVSDIKVTETITGEEEGLYVFLTTIANTCKCPQSNIVLKCVAFSSPGLPVDPAIIKKHGDFCTLNSGRPLVQGTPVKFSFGSHIPQDFIPVSSTITC